MAHRGPPLCHPERGYGKGGRRSATPEGWRTLAGGNTPGTMQRKARTPAGVQETCPFYTPSERSESASAVEGPWRGVHGWPLFLASHRAVGSETFPPRSQTAFGNAIGCEALLRREHAHPPRFAPSLPRSQTASGNALGCETVFRREHANLLPFLHAPTQRSTASQDSAFPNAVWERGKRRGHVPLRRVPLRRVPLRPGGSAEISRWRQPPEPRPQSQPPR